MKTPLRSLPPLLPLLLGLAGLGATQARGAELVSASLGQPLQAGVSSDPSISGDGRYVVFSSFTRYSGRDTNSLRSDVFLKDRLTGRLRQISDERGGDHPLISANGRFVLFRALDAFPKLRLADLESPEVPRTVSFPFGGGGNRSFRWVTTGMISPDGKFVGFPFYPIPVFNQVSTPLLCVNPTTNPDRVNATTAVPNDSFFQTLGDGAMNRTGSTFFVETRDPLDANDNNGFPDIYRIVQGSTTAVRLSTPEAGLPDAAKSARDPVASANGNTVFFISERRLRTSDTDGRATIYRSSSANGFVLPTPLPTEVKPLRLSQQAVGNGEYLAFLGQADGEPARPYVMRVSDGSVRALASSALNPAGAPAISADNGTIVFASADALASGDFNGQPDIFAVENPFAGARLGKPVVSLTGPNDGAVLNTNSQVNLSATATNAVGIFTTALEVDGQEIQSANGGSVSKSLTLPLGDHRIRAVSLSSANVPGKSATIEVVVRPTANLLTITSVRNLKRQMRSDGTTDFQANLRLDNTFSSTKGSLQVLLTLQPALGSWETFGDTSTIPPQPERVLGLVTGVSLGANGQKVVPVSGNATRPEVVGDGFQGLGWYVVAQLRENVGGDWVTRHQVTLFDIKPRLEEDTPGPNGGIPVLGSDPNAPVFDPATLQSLQITGPGKVVEQASGLYSASLVFSNGTQPCLPKWEIINGGQFASISPSGVLTVNDLSAGQNITLKASFGALSKTLSVELKPLAPLVSVVASVKFAAENGPSGVFRVTRTPVENTPLPVRYTVSGRAQPGQDYTALSGIVTIGAGQAAANINVIPLDDNTFEGREPVTITLKPATNLRRSQARTATVKIDDDEPPQADAIIRAKDGGKPVGAFEINFDSSTQKASAPGIINRPTVFIVSFINRTAAAKDFQISGGSDFLGYQVRYFSGDTDVTGAVVAGTFTSTQVPTDGRVALELRITPTSSTPMGGLIRCPVLLNFGDDAVEAVVRRVR